MPACLPGQSEGMTKKFEIERGLELSWLQESSGEDRTPVVLAPWKPRAAPRNAGQEATPRSEFNPLLQPSWTWEKSLKP